MHEKIIKTYFEETGRDMLKDMNDGLTEYEEKYGKPKKPVSLISLKNENIYFEYVKNKWVIVRQENK